VLAAAKIVQGQLVLDVATGTGEAAALAIPIVGSTDFVVGADISLEMVRSARARLDASNYGPVNADGQAAIQGWRSMPLYVSLACNSFPTQPRA
jgi:ubiquinone/menaquinone biosynthesis C-methylase UbiE